ALFRHGLEAVQRLVDQPLLLRRRAHLRAIAARSLARLTRLLRKDLRLRRQQRPAGVKGLFLEGNCGGDVLIRRLDEGEARGPADRRGADLLRLEPITLGKEVQQLRPERLFLRPNLIALEFNQHLAGPDLLALADVDRGDDPAVAMLDRLALAGDLQLAGRISCRIHRREGCPAKEDHEEERRDDRAEAELGPRVVDRDVARRPRERRQVELLPARDSVHWFTASPDLVVPRTAALTLPSAAGFWSRAMTSSRLPKASTRPSRITRILSDTASTDMRCAISATAAPRDLAATIVCSSWASPSASRWALGSSSNNRGGSRNSARASAMRCAWPAERPCPSQPSIVS